MREEPRRSGDARWWIEEVSTVPAALKRVCERFPRLVEQSTTRFAIDDTFRDLCEDYDACAETLVHLECSGGAEEMRAEYAALLLRLERELLRHLGERQGGES